MTIRCAALFAIMGFFCAAACGEDPPPVDAAGSYTVAVTSDVNGCGFENWNQGSTWTAIPLLIEQPMASAPASASFDGQLVLFLDLLLGSDTFSGEVSGNALSLRIGGTQEQTTSGCTHTVVAALNAQLNGDVLLGTLSYSVAENSLAECAALIGCESVQTLNGTRPAAPAASAAQ